MIFLGLIVVSSAMRVARASAMALWVAEKLPWAGAAGEMVGHGHGRVVGGGVVDRGLGLEAGLAAEGDGVGGVGVKAEGVAYRRDVLVRVHGVGEGVVGDSEGDSPTAAGEDPGGLAVVVAVDEAVEVGDVGAGSPGAAEGGLEALRTAEGHGRDAGDSDGCDVRVRIGVLGAVDRPAGSWGAERD